MYLDRELMQEAVRLAEGHRDYLHTVPEMALNEYETTAYIRKMCEGYPVEMIDLGMETGAVCLLDGGHINTVALRADIDAVPTEHGPKHLCGHDAHTATLLGAMHYLCAVKNELPYNVLFIFQPAEEGTRGAKTLLEHGLLDALPERPIRIFGIHNRPEVDCGKVVVHRGPLMSEKSVFTIRFIGKAGHGSLPHKCVDPIVAAGSFICGLQSVVSRNVDPFKPVICALNSVNGGRADNSAPETAELTGNIRSFDHDTHVRVSERVKKLAESTAEAYECKCEADIIPMVPAVNNSRDMYRIALEAAEEAVGSENITDSEPCLASEDFAVYGTEIPSFFYWVGSGIPGKENAPWHDPAFCMDPRYMETAVPVLCASAIIE